MLQVVKRTSLRQLEFQLPLELKTILVDDWDMIEMKRKVSRVIDQVFPCFTLDCRLFQVKHLEFLKVEGGRQLVDFLKFCTVVCPIELSCQLFLLSLL